MKNINYIELYKASFFAFFIKGLSILAGYCFVLMISKYYGATGMGLYSIAYTLLLIFSIVYVAGFDAASIKFVSESSSIDVIRSIYFKILKIVIPLSLFVSIVVFLFSNITFEYFTNKEIIENIKYICFGILPLSIINIHAESFRGYKNIPMYSILRFTLIPIIACIALFLYEFLGFHNFHNPVTSYILAIYIVCFFSIIIWFKKISFFKEKIKIENYSYKRILNLAFPMLLTTSMFYIIQWTDTVILSYYEHPSNIGIYNVALKISMASSIILFSINSIAAPQYSKLFSLNKMDEFKNVVKFSSRLIFWLSIPIIIIIATKAEFILSIFGDDFISGKISLLILLIGQLVNVLSGSVGYILMMTNKQMILRNIVFCSALLNILFNFILIPKYGIIGSAISSTLSLALWNICSVLYIYRKYGFITTSIFK